MEGWTSGQDTMLPAGVVEVSRLRKSDLLSIFLRGAQADIYLEIWRTSQFNLSLGWLPSKCEAYLLKRWNWKREIWVLDVSSKRALFMQWSFCQSVNEVMASKPCETDNVCRKMVHDDYHKLFSDGYFRPWILGLPQKWWLLHGTKPHAKAPQSFDTKRSH